MNPGPAASVLVFRIGSLGDTVVALPAFREIRRRHPGARIVLLTNSPVDGGVRAASAMQVLAGMGLVEEVIEYPHGSRALRKLWNLVWRIRAAAPRRCYYLMPGRSEKQSRRDRIFLRLAGIRDFTGLHVEPPGNLPPREGGILWESEARRLMRTIGATDRALRQDDFSLALSATEQSAAQEILSSAGIPAGFLAISIGAKRPVNDWGDERWRRCLAAIARALPGLPIVAVGAHSEAARTQALLAQWGGSSLNLCGRVAPRVSAAVIAHAKLYLGHDSGPMHLAYAGGTPVVAIFSAREVAGKWFPFAQEHNVFDHDVPCRGCELEVCVEQGHRCMTQVDPEDVVARVLQLLGSQEAYAARAGSADVAAG